MSLWVSQTETEMAWVLQHYWTSASEVLDVFDSRPKFTSQINEGTGAFCIHGDNSHCTFAHTVQLLSSDDPVCDTSYLWHTMSGGGYEWSVHKPHSGRRPIRGPFMKDGYNASGNVSSLSNSNWKWLCAILLLWTVSSDSSVVIPLAFCAKSCSWRTLMAVRLLSSTVPPAHSRSGAEAYPACPVCEGELTHCYQFIIGPHRGTSNYPHPRSP